LRGDTVVSEEPGPFRDFALNEDISSWTPRCSVKETGELRCTFRGEDLELDIPEEPFVSVSVGFFNICALAESGTLHCFVPAQIGGLSVVPDVAGAYSVDMNSVCMQLDSVHAACFDDQGEALLPVDGHYLDVAAAPQAGCAAVLAGPSGVPNGSALDPSILEALNKNCIACFSKDDVTIHTEGVFSTLDVDVDRDGCAIGDGVRCWGKFEENLPVDLGPRITQISVSSTQACALHESGTVSCWKAAF
jgi:hypothetical protein